MKPLTAAFSSVLVALLVLGLKWLAYRLTGSVALYSDALESIINVVAAAAALLAIWISARPADKNHPYGHHKAEYLSAGAEGVLIVLAALAILWTALPQLLQPRGLALDSMGLGVSVLASLINGAWAWNLLHVGRKHRSPALVADGHHVLSDVWSSLGVLVGVLAAALTGWVWLDPLLAVLVALHILWSGYKVVDHSIGGLMDKAADERTETLIRRLVSEHATGALEIHDLRTRTAGATLFIEFHLVVAGDMTVGEAHAICDRLEEVLHEQIEGAAVTIHVEPQEQAKHSGVLVI